MTFLSEIGQLAHIIDEDNGRGVETGCAQSTKLVGGMIGRSENRIVVARGSAGGLLPPSYCADFATRIWSCAALGAA
jgi:hypothetical protein